MPDEQAVDPLTNLSVELERTKARLDEMQTKLDSANANMSALIDANKRLLAVSRTVQEPPSVENYLENAIKIFRKELNIGE